MKLFRVVLTLTVVGVFVQIGNLVWLTTHDSALPLWYFWFSMELCPGIMLAWVVVLDPIARLMRHIRGDNRAE